MCLAIKIPLRRLGFAVPRAEPDYPSLLRSSLNPPTCAMPYRCTYEKQIPCEKGGVGVAAWLP